MVLKLNLIAAACENMGIGKNNNLPWRLKYGKLSLCTCCFTIPYNLRAEMNYFSMMTTKTEDVNKKNVVIMGRKTWDSIPPKYKPLPNRINFVLSRSNIDLGQYDNVYLFNSLQNAVEKLSDGEFKDRFETVWVIGGSSIYKVITFKNIFIHIYFIVSKFVCFDI